MSAETLKVLFIQIRFKDTDSLGQANPLAGFDKAYGYSGPYARDMSKSRWQNYAGVNMTIFSTVAWLHWLGSFPFVQPVMLQLEQHIGKSWPPAFPPSCFSNIAPTTGIATPVGRGTNATAAPRPSKRKRDETVPTHGRTRSSAAKKIKVEQDRDT
jgi:hypothetical protein